MHFYIVDLIETGGSKSVGKVRGLAQGMLKTMGIFTEKDIEEFAEARIKARMKTVTPKKAEQMAKAMEIKIRTITPLFEEAQKLMSTVYDGVLLEQGVVAGATAIEIYFEDILTDLLERNGPALEQQFEGLLADRLRYRHLLRASGSLSRAYAHAILDAAGSARFSDRLDVLARVVDKGALAVEPGNLLALDRLIEQRNLIAHRGGVVNEWYRRRTGSREAVDAKLRLVQASVEGSIETASAAITEIHAGLAMGTRRTK